MLSAHSRYFLFQIISFVTIKLTMKVSLPFQRLAKKLSIAINEMQKQNNYLEDEVRERKKGEGEGESLTLFSWL